MNNNHPILQRPIAHRGLWNKNIPENSIASFRNAIMYHYGIEFDVQMTRDGVPIVFHDDDLDRLTGDKRMVKDCSQEELSELSLTTTNEHIPTLEETLRLVSGRVPLYVEIKGERGPYQEKVDCIVDTLCDYTGAYIIASFDVRIISYIAKRYPHITVAQIFGDKNILKSLASRIGWYLHGRKGNMASVPCTSIDKLFFKSIRSQGCPLLTWTACTKDEYDNVRQYSDQIIFEGFRP